MSLDQDGVIPTVEPVDPAKAKALELIDANSIRFQRPFRSWVDENWPLWLRFEAEAFAVNRSGRERYSARTIIEFLRHETFIRESMSTSAGSTEGYQYKINNSWVPDCARLFGLIHPHLAEFFECRELANPVKREVIRGLPSQQKTLDAVPQPIAETADQVEASEA